MRQKYTAIKNGVLISVIVVALAPSLALATGDAPATAPVVITAPDSSIVAAILSAARDSSNKIQDSSMRLVRLISLSKAYIKTNNVEEARKVLAEARSIQDLSRVPSYTYGELIVLSDQIGDSEVAISSALTAPYDLSKRVSFLAEVGVSKALRGDSSGALSMLQQIRTAVKSHVENAPDTREIREVDLATFMPDYGQAIAIRKIGEALASKGDIGQALELAKILEDKEQLLNLLMAIVRAQVKTSNKESYTQTLQRIKTLTDELSKEGKLLEVVRKAAEAFIIAGDVNGAKAITDQLPEETRNFIFSDIAKRTADNGDIAHAQQMLALMPEPNRDGPLLAIGKEQFKQGNKDQARETLLKAYAVKMASTRADLKSMAEPADRAAAFKHKDILQAHIEGILSIGEALAKLGDIALARQMFVSAYNLTSYVSELVNIDLILRDIFPKQIAVGAFSDALITVKKMKPLNRLPHFVIIVEEASKQGNAQALRESIPAAIEASRNAHYTSAESGLAALALALSAAGDRDNAKLVLVAAQKEADSLRGWQRMDSLTAIQKAQIAMNDEAGAAATAKEKQEEKNPITPAARAFAAKTGNTKAGLVLLSHDARYSNLDDIKNEENALELIKQHDYPKAMETVQLIKKAPTKDRAFEGISFVLAQQGQYQQAFEAAKSVDDPSRRAEALLGLIPN